MKSLAKIYKALADETRLNIMSLLFSAKPSGLCVCHIMRRLKISQTKASRHLRYLTNAGLITDHRNNVWVYYSLRSDLPEQARTIVTHLKNVISSAT